MKNIGILLIIVSLASLGGLEYPTVPINRTSTSTQYRLTSLLVQSTETVDVMQGSVTLKLCFLAVTNYFTANAGDIFIITSPPPGVTVGVLDLGVGEVIHEAFLMAKTYDDYQLECGVAYGLRGAVVNNTWTATYSSVYYLVFFQPPDSPSMPNIEFILSKITVSANSLATTLPYSTTVTNPTKIPYATSGISGIMSLLLVAALFLAGVGLLFRARKISTKL